MTREPQSIDITALLHGRTSPPPDYHGDVFRARKALSDALAAREALVGSRLETLGVRPFVRALLDGIDNDVREAHQAVVAARAELVRCCAAAGVEV